MESRLLTEVTRYKAGRHDFPREENTGLALLQAGAGGFLCELQGSHSEAVYG